MNVIHLILDIWILFYICKCVVVEGMDTMNFDYMAQSGFCHNRGSLSRLCDV